LSGAPWEARQAAARSSTDVAGIGKAAAAVQQQLTEIASGVHRAPVSSPQPVLARITMPVDAVIQLDGRAMLDAQLRRPWATKPAGSST
jgi:hypothetical protein